MADTTPPLRLRQGDAYTLSVVWRGPNQDDGTPGTPVDLTGYTFSWHIAVGAVIQNFTGSPEVVPATDRTTGQITLRLPTSVTSTFLTGRGRHWLVATTAGGDQTTLLIGDVDVDFRK